MRLITRWQNSAGERVRIALRLKKIECEYVPVGTLAPGEYRRLNPQGLLPALDIGGRIVAQSSAILEYLEETFPVPALLPADPVTRAEARAFAAHITSEMHAITVRRVRRYLGTDLGVDEDHVDRWVSHWLTEGFRALEIALANRATDWPFCFGEAPGWADLHLIPQIENGRRLGVDLMPFPRLLGVEERCNALEAFILSRPAAQPDYPGERLP
ncbi:maleylacetoacetate isomerase [Nisaea sediminum]|uniref:maleylacetoacetate isomerase n=1 Tax=Nisaea sediminum TaxID=2775867 RepID=UPI0018663DD6|nr:maleylacetoacetate isomerase [Nisaea sediminum]